MVLIGVDVVELHKYDNLTGPKYIHKKSDVAKIIFENGSVESFEEPIAIENRRIDEIRQVIIDYMNEYKHVACDANKTSSRN